MTTFRVGAVLAVLLVAGSTGSGRAQEAPAPHITDGIFGNGEWTVPNPNPASVTYFPYDPSTGAGGSYLYVAQGPPAITPAAISGGGPGGGGGGFGQNLYLAYDYVQATTPATPSTFFDIFFQVPTDDNQDYLVRVFNNGTPFEAFEKPDNVLSPTTPAGNFDPTSTSPNNPWTPLSSDDLALAQFQIAIGFGTSPSPIGGSTPHQIVEFQLSIFSSTGPNGPNGVYSPDPAFWSASQGSTTGNADPVLASEIFTLNPNGSTTTTPALGPNGGPVLEPQFLATPEPSSILMALVGALGILGYRAVARST